MSDGLESQDSSSIEVSVEVVPTMGFAEMLIEHVRSAIRVQLVQEGQEGEPSNELVAHGLSQLGQEMLRAGNPDQSFLCFQSVLQLDPTSASAHHGSGLALEQLGRTDEALESFKAAHDLVPEEGVIARDIAEIYRLRCDGAEACTWYEQALSGGFGTDQVHHNWAFALRAMGKFDEAEHHFGKVLEQNPTCTLTWNNKVRVKKYRAEDVSHMEELEHLRRLLSEPSYDDSDRARIHFAISKICNDMNRWDDAFLEAKEGNELLGTEGYDFNKEDRAMREVAQCLPQLLDEYVEAGNQSDAPVFIVGMNRSGTTVLHQMLSMHPDIAGAGEYDGLGHFDQNVRMFEGGASHCAEQQHIAQFAESYLQGLPKRCQGKKRSVDMMNSNYKIAGLIPLLFPNARVIHCSRDPMDTCVSNYMTYFGAGNRWSNDLTTMGKVYRQYQEVMDRYEPMLPQLLHVQYEDLVERPEDIAREMLEFCGVEWDPQCLNFHENPGEIWTASEYGARQPLNANSIGRWKRYEKHLGPLQDALAGEQSMKPQWWKLGSGWPFKK